MALDAIFEVLNSLFAVFAQHVSRRVLMATVTRVLAEVAPGVARRAGCVVIFVEQKELVVFETGGFPRGR